ncbi:MAG: hypothetical protein COZ06_26465 [Armatimonadetes bacterium CG_4_10_14_3_um_filter_66_18]|nr:hypothetical protein [Armatimonadota bacterium]OIO93257.1 MAG: hypothetical protein AUJ96_30730 [Armatimonadetes bacterium CG2_30_66_41]PIX46449.1 MAG: hypothetical protein COZ57_11985 [Armatimonadetes bacterium CG_4_8_14_3_um_filter_66_20]PIY41524.1 MAG: hypothetical protein COZ06_26465 [Armatimonadetes bacterium CG_4_10_14_3_um_filter_66_18]PIZ42528.1 MAG: hypothetical protein COY42_17425 [Armatimonadetes bacterium CG_4_10_14_0_8_um_filter_66_14]PJB65625.1 MAG: hypothetical protein CO096_
MTLRDILDDIHALTRDIEAYERKYGVLSETFYRAYSAGEEPADDSWILDWAGWAGAYKTLLRRQEQYGRLMQAVEQESRSLGEVIAKAARRELLPVAA